MAVTDPSDFVTLEEVKPQNEKSRKFDAVALAIFKILLKGGPQNISHSAVSRASGVSRAWLYKYIGKNPQDLIHFSIDAVGKGFARLEGWDKQSSADEVRKSLVEGTYRMIEDATRDPALLALYYRYAGTENSIGQKIHDLEKVYLATLQLRFEKFFKLPKAEASAVAEVLHGLRMGLAHRAALRKLDSSQLQKSLRRILRHFLDEIGA